MNDCRNLQGELRLCHRQWTKNPAETTGMRYKIRKIEEPDAAMEGDQSAALVK